MKPVIALANAALKDKGRVSLDGVTLSIEAGSLVAIVGPADSGASELLDAMAGFVRLSGGTVAIETRGRGGRPELGYLGKRDAFDCDTEWRDEFFRLLSLSATPPGESAGLVEEAVRKAGLDPRSLKDFPETRQERRSLALARAFLGNPEIILLDEPETGLDAERGKALRDTLRALKAEATVVTVSESIPSFETLCDALYFMEAGKLTKRDALPKAEAGVASMTFRLDSDFRPDFALELPMIPGIAQAEKIDSTTVRVTLMPGLGEGDARFAIAMAEEYFRERSYAIVSKEGDGLPFE